MSTLPKNERHDTLKYEYVKRKTYDYFSDKTVKKFDGILHRLSVVESYAHDLHHLIETLEAELESIRLDKTSVRIAGRRDASVRRE